MPLFKKTGTNFLGVDLGTASIKIVELKNEKGHARLITYGIAESSGDIIRSNAPAAANKVVSLLKYLKQRSRVTTGQAIAALPPFSVFSSILSLPPMPKSDLTQAVKWEAKKFVPMPLEEMILDWKELKSLTTGNKPSTQARPGVNVVPVGSAEGVNFGDGENGQTDSNSTDSNSEDMQAEEDRVVKSANQPPPPGPRDKSNHRVLITAAPRNLVSRYIDIFKQADLKLISLETESFALARSLLFGTRLPVMIIDIGSLTTAISIVEDGVPILSRSLDVGGATLTRAIATSLNIDQQRAEQFKRDIGVVPSSAASGIPKVIEQTLNPILNEVKYSLNLYQSQTNQGVEKIMLVGGSAFLPSLTDFLSQVLNLNVYIGDPWFRVSYPEDLKSVLDEVGSRLAVATGLAMRDIE